MILKHLVSSYSNSGWLRNNRWYEMLASQNIWLLYPFISGSNQYSKLMCVQSCIYTFLLLIQISCSAYLEITLLLVPRQGWWQPSRDWLLHPVSGCWDGGSKALCRCESWILPQGKKLGENKGEIRSQATSKWDWHISSRRLGEGTVLQSAGQLLSTASFACQLYGFGFLFSFETSRGVRR